MLEQAVAELDLSRYRRWLGRMAGADYPLALVCEQGKLLWAEGGDIGMVCQAETAAGLDWHCDGTGMQRHACAGGELLFYIPL